VRQLGAPFRRVGHLDHEDPLAQVSVVAHRWDRVVERPRAGGDRERDPVSAQRGGERDELDDRVVVLALGEVPQERDEQRCVARVGGEARLRHLIPGFQIQRCHVGQQLLHVLPCVHALSSSIGLRRRSMQTVPHVRERSRHIEERELVDTGGRRTLDLGFIGQTYLTNERS
jgi:hypothetical protein